MMHSVNISYFQSRIHTCGAKLSNISLTGPDESNNTGIGQASNLRAYKTKTPVNERPQSTKKFWKTRTTLTLVNKNLVSKETVVKPW